MNDLVERMLKAYKSAQNGAPGDYQMTAAAKVLLDAALGDVTPMEWSQAVMAAGSNGIDISSHLLATRKARLLAPKTVEERVTINIDSAYLGWCVYLDGKRVFGHENTSKDAETYRRGLIAEMKEKG